MIMPISMVKQQKGLRNDLKFLDLELGFADDLCLTGGNHFQISWKLVAPCEGQKIWGRTQ